MYPDRSCRLPNSIGKMPCVTCVKRMSTRIVFTEGINLVGFEGLPLGWVKRIGHRANNLYPKEWRILNV